MELEEFHYGDPAPVPPGFAGAGFPPQGVWLAGGNRGAFVELVQPEDLQAFLDQG